MSVKKIILVICYTVVEICLDQTGGHTNIAIHRARTLAWLTTTCVSLRDDKYLTKPNNCAP